MATSDVLLGFAQVGVSALVGVAASLITNALGARSQKFRKYEEHLIPLRVAKCNELLNMMRALSSHLSPIAKGTRALEIPEGRTPNDAELAETKQTTTLRVNILEFVDANAIYLGRDLCVTAIYCEAGFDEIADEVSIRKDTKHVCFTALFHWTFDFEDQIKQSIARTLRNADFSLPAIVDIQTSRVKGYQDARKLMESIAKNPKQYSLSQRNVMLRERARRRRFLPIRNWWS